mgnify:CR=1 FL=1
MCRKVPFALGTDCKSLYDVCTKNVSMGEAGRVALDLLDIRVSIEEFGDKRNSSMIEATDAKAFDEKELI